MPTAAGRRPPSPAQYEPVLNDPRCRSTSRDHWPRGLDSAFDWNTVGAEGAQVYLTAERREHRPHRRSIIVEHHGFPTAGHPVAEYVSNSSTRHPHR